VTKSIRVCVATQHWSAMNTISSLVCAAFLYLMAVSAGPAGAVTMTYTSDTAYFAAAGPQSLQDFDSPISNTATSVTYPNLVVSCSGSGFCNSASFGATTFPVSITGLSIFFTSPSVVTFTFDSPIHSFGIYVAGLGTISPGSTTFSISNSNGFSANLFTN
jgi:hypothetical protein